MNTGRAKSIVSRTLRVLLILISASTPFLFLRARAEYIGPAHREVIIPGDDFTVITGRLFRWSTATYVCDYEIRTDTNKVHAGSCTQGQWNDQPTCQAYRDCVDNSNPNCDIQPYPTCAGYYRRSPFDSYVVTKSQTIQLPNASVSATFQCPSYGNAAWCVSDGFVEILGIEPVPEHVIMMIEGMLNGTPFACAGDMCAVPIPDGIHDLDFWALSSWGDSSTMDSLQIKVDSHAPSVHGTASGLMGADEWFISPVLISVTGDDPVSGLESAKIRVNGGSWFVNSTTLTDDGRYAVDFNTTDSAGNQSDLQSISIKIDQSVPRLVISNPQSGGPIQVSDNLRVNGICEDGLSGVGKVEMSSDNGMSWQSVETSGDGSWFYVWNLQSAATGNYQIAFRCSDQAGNHSDRATVRAIVERRGPTVVIPNQWNIWESPQIQINEGSAPIKDVIITVQDPEDRWPNRVYTYIAGNLPGTINWDRRFGDGILAPPGRYAVYVIARDTFGNQGDDQGIVVIPQPASQTSPSPTVISNNTSINPLLILSTTPLPVISWTQSVSALDLEATPENIPPTPQSVTLSFHPSSTSSSTQTDAEEITHLIPHDDESAQANSLPLWGLSALALGSAVTAAVISRRRTKKKPPSKDQPIDQIPGSDQSTYAAGNTTIDLSASDDYPPYIAERVWNRLPMSDRDYINRQYDAWVQNGLPIQGISIGDNRYVHIDLSALNRLYSYARDDTGLLLDDNGMPVINAEDITSLGLDSDLLQGDIWVDYNIPELTQNLNIHSEEGSNWTNAVMAAYAKESEASLAIRLLISEIGADRLLTNANGFWESQAILNSVYERIEALSLTEPDDLEKYGFAFESRPLFGDHVAQFYNVVTSPGQYLGMYTSRALKPLSLYTGGDTPLLTEEEYLTTVDLAFSSYALTSPALNQLELAIPDFTGSGRPMLDQDGNEIAALHTLGATRYVHRCGYAGALNENYGQAFTQTYGLTTPHCDTNSSCYTAETNPATGPLVLSEFLRFDENLGYYLYRESLQVDYVPHSLIDTGNNSFPPPNQNSSPSPPINVNVPNTNSPISLRSDDLFRRIE